ncbi:MAG: chemotaxis protein CheD [Candidatus Hydrogenedentes bacterium]|nr:chemotaxis protein CheD [Candidatus Hydrogenedentota bacterium]
MLPSSAIDPAKAQTTPCMFVDTGVPALIQAVSDMSAQAGNACGSAVAGASRLIAKVAGAASLLGGQGAFKIGERNYIVLRKLLEENHIQVAAEETGGTIARTLYLYMSSGRTMIKALGKERELA